MKKTISEAPESNAGDDFHVLWTIKKTFNLLNFEDDGLKAITIEGIDPKNALKLDPYGNQLLGVDIAEYFGGENFNDAKKVVVSQLKYSTRRVNENWTFSKLYKGKKSGSTDGSLVHRLAQIYKTFLKEFGRDSVLEKLSLKLVSNRNISSGQKQIILDIQEFLIKKKSKTYLKKILDSFPKKQTILKKLQSATKLEPVEFVDFLRLLDFEDCGTNSSYNQELEIIAALRNIGIQNLNQSDSLFRMVWRKMLPEAIAIGKNKITEIDLLHCLQMSMERLFPVSHSFEEIENLVERKQVKTLIDEIIKNNTGKPICLHAGAGIGKSTISQLINKNFSKDSEVILFDCYGAGSYLNPSDSRHLHKEAILQISNEMAKKIGSPFLLSTDSESHILIRELKSRIGNAISILQKRNPNSILVLIVDAADNSVTAAEKSQTKSFIQDLVNENYADGFRLIVTSRSHRVDSLGLPENYIDIPLDPFDLEETETHLKFYFPESTKEEIQDFHNLTSGIPRVQTYALDLKNQGIEEVINYLKPNGKKVEDLIQERIVEAAKKLGSNGTEIINIFFANLISLPRPVPTSYIGVISGLSEKLLQDLSTDIWHGLVLDNNNFSFRDEDFENYIRGRYKSNDEIYSKIADLFLDKANEDEYASINLGIALYEAKYEEKLKDIVLNEEYKALPVDPVRKKEVYIERTKLAMKVSSDADDNLAFFKLAFVAADAAKTDVALNNLLISNADLVASFGETDSLQRLHLQSEEKSWSGSFHYQLAAIYSRETNSTELAKRHLKTAEKWVEWLMREKETEELRNYRIIDEDIAYGAEAYLRIFGSQVAFNWLNRWTPKETVFRATNYLIDEVLKYSDEKQILEWLEPLSLPIYTKLMILQKVKFSETSPFNLNYIGETILKLLSRGLKFKIHLLPSILSFCELNIRSSLSNKEKVLKILEQINVQLPDSVPSLIDNPYMDNNEEIAVDSYLKKWALKAVLIDSSLKLEDIYPEKFKVTKKEEDYESRRYREDEKRKFDGFYKHAISIYQLRADVFIKKDKDKLKSQLQAICKSINDDWDFRYYDSHWVQYKLNFLALILIDVLPFIENNGKLLETVIKSFENKNQNCISLRIAITKKVSSIEKLKQHTYKLLDEIDSLIQESAFTSSDMVNYYIQSARIIRSIDEQVSRFYFEKAVDAVSEIDIEAQEQIKCLYSLSKLGITKENPHLAFEFARFVEFCDSRLSGYDHFPLDEGIKGITYLDCATSFSVICRWSHRYVADITEQILPILRISLEKGFMTPEIGSSMLPLNIYYWKSYVECIEVLIEKFDTTNNGRQKSSFVNNILRDIQINCGTNEKKETVKSIYEAIKDGRFINRDVISNFEKYHQFITNLHSNSDEEKSSRQAAISKQESEDEKIIKVDVKEVNVVSTSSLNEALKRIRADDEYHFVRPQISQFLSDIKDICTPENYVQHLDALIDINTDLISLYSFEDALKERLEYWNFHPLVERWKKQNFGKALKIWFSNFSWSDGIYYEGVRRFANVFSIEDPKLTTIIFEILPAKIDELGATALYQTIAFLKNRLTQKENEDLICWVLSRWNSKIKENFADGVWDDKHIPSGNSVEVIAKTIRFVLGHPDKRIRWRGVHALRRIVNSGNSSILKILLNQQNTRNCLPFQNGNYTYFWISAKLYLWICIERLSKENPSEICQFKNDIFQESQNKELPHALILYFIKQTCLNLINYDDSIFSRDEKNSINKLLVSKFKPVKEERLKRKQRKHNSQNGKWKFDFDALDTLPYWYRQLGRCFNLSEYDVADLADKCISGKLGFTGNPRDDDHVKEEWSLTSNRHGSLPVVENLRRYYEYHGMYCAAIDLLEKEPLLETEPYSWESWEHWLESEALTWKEFWLSDLRDPIPLDKKFWISEFDKFDEKWKDGVEDSHYDEILGLSSDSEINTIIPYGGYTQYFEGNYESVSVNSAIVSPKTSEALLRALQTAKDNYDYRVPLEDDELQINEKDFQLIGWLRQISSEYEGLDKNDPFANEIRKSYILFGSEVENVFEINYSEDFKLAFYNDEKVFECQNWSDEVKLRNSTDGSSGYLLKIDSSFLMKFLQKKEMHLLIECTITRRLKDRNYSFEKAERKNNAKLYLIKLNGEVKTIRGRNYKIG